MIHDARWPDVDRDIPVGFVLLLPQAVAMTESSSALHGKVTKKLVQRHHRYSFRSKLTRRASSEAVRHQRRARGTERCSSRRSCGLAPPPLSTSHREAYLRLRTCGRFFCLQRRLFLPRFNLSYFDVLRRSLLHALAPSSRYSVATWSSDDEPLEMIRAMKEYLLKRVVYVADSGGPASDSPQNTVIIIELLDYTGL